MGNLDSQTIESVPQLIEALKSVDFEPAWFRGQANENWPLKPGVLRSETLRNNEVNIFRRFRQETARFAPSRVTTQWDWLAWAQHNLLPTRLLDWSLNPLVGLYFATMSHDDVDGRLFCLSPTQLNGKVRADGGEVLLLDHAEEIDDYLPGAAVKKLLGPIAVTSPKTFGRITMQSGVFTISSPTDSKEFQDHAEDSLISWVIPGSKKLAIRHELTTLRIEESTMMDTPDHFSRSIRKEYGGSYV